MLDCEERSSSFGFDEVDEKEILKEVGSVTGHIERDIDVDKVGLPAYGKHVLDSLSPPINNGVGSHLTS